MSQLRFMNCCARLTLLTSALLAAHPASALTIDSKAEIHPTAVLMGNVTVGAYTKIGPKVVIQGDVTIGHHVNILGSAVISADKLTVGNYVRIDYGARVVDGRPAAPGITANRVPDQLYIRDGCWVGINATVRGSRLEEGSAVGNDAVADFNTHLEKGAILAHGAVSAYDMVIPANALAEGNPATITKGAWLEDFANTNIATTAAFGTRIGREALLLNGSATYAGQQLPPRSISYGDPARLRLTDSTMRERMVFFYGRDWPTWERQANPDELKAYKPPR